MCSLKPHGHGNTPGRGGETHAMVGKGSCRILLMGRRKGLEWLWSMDISMKVENSKITMLSVLRRSHRHARTDSQFHRRLGTASAQKQIACLTMKEAFNYNLPFGSKVPAQGLTDRISALTPFVECQSLRMIAGCAIDVKAFGSSPEVQKRSGRTRSMPPLKNFLSLPSWGHLAKNTKQVLSVTMKRVRHSEYTSCTVR